GGSMSFKFSAVKFSFVIVAKSEPLPLTHSTSTSSPLKFFSTLFTDVFPPPQFTIDLSLPKMLDLYTSSSRLLLRFLFSVHKFSTIIIYASILINYFNNQFLSFIRYFFFIFFYVMQPFFSHWHTHRLAVIIPDCTKWISFKF